MQALQNALTGGGRLFDSAELAIFFDVAAKGFQRFLEYFPSRDGRLDISVPALTGSVPDILRLQRFERMLYGSSQPGRFDRAQQFRRCVNDGPRQLRVAFREDFQ